MKEKLKKLYNFSNSWTGTIIIVLLIIFFVAQAFVIPSGSMKNTLLIGDHLFVKKFSYGIPTPHLPWLEVPVLPDFRGNGHLIDGDGPEREDIVVFRWPGNEKIHYVKRCFAVGGDEVIFIEKNLFLHPHEGDEYVKKNYKKDKIITINNKLWVRNPYMDKYPGIHYDESINIFNQMVLHFSTDGIGMKPVFLNELPKINGSTNFNAFYTKVPENNYFMIGDNRDHSADSRFWGFTPYRLIVGKPWFIYFSWNDNYEIRWNRIGRFVSSFETDADFVNGK